MRKFVGFILIAVFFAIGSVIPMAYAKVKHSAARSEEQRHGRTVKNSSDGNDKKEKRKSARDANEPSKQANADKPKDPQQQLKVLESQMAGEKERFLERKVELERTMDLATQQNDKKRADLAKELLAKEQQQYDQKKQLQEEKRQKLLDLIQKESPKDANKPAK